MRHPHDTTYNMPGEEIAAHIDALIERHGEEYVIRAIESHDDLLAACKDLHAWMTDHGCVPPCLTDAAAAIAKAEGGAA